MRRDQSSTWKDLVAILFFCVVARVLATTFFPEVASTFYGELLAQAVMYVLLVLFCAMYVRLDRATIVGLIGPRPTGRAWMFAIAWTLAMLMFTFGESALEAWTVSQFNRDLAYRLWHFHEAHDRTYPPYSLPVLVYVVVAVLFGPAAEELFFRGLLLPALAVKRSVHAAVVIQAVAFTLLHVAHPYLLSTFLFATSLGYVYLVTRSLLLCVGIHAGFNLLAFLHQYYFDIHWTRSVTELGSLAYWRPQWAMLLVSCVVIALAIYANWGRLRSTMASPDWNPVFGPNSSREADAKR